MLVEKGCALSHIFLRSYGRRSNVKNSMKVYVADRDLKGAQALAEELNTGDQVVWAVEADVTNWDSQRKAWEAAETDFKRIDYVFPIAGIGERRAFPNRPNSTGYEKPDLSVLEVDCIGVVYTIGLAVEHFRRQQPNKYGFKGKSKFIICKIPAHDSNRYF